MEAFSSLHSLIFFFISWENTRWYNVELYEHIVMTTSKQHTSSHTTIKEATKQYSIKIP